MVHRHPMRRAYPDCWHLVGAHIDSGESPHRAVSRECREELGVYIHDPLPIPMTVSDPTLDMHAFLVTRWEGDLSTPHPTSTTTFAGSGPAISQTWSWPTPQACRASSAPCRWPPTSTRTVGTSAMSASSRGAPGVPQDEPVAGRPPYEWPAADKGVPPAPSGGRSRDTGVSRHANESAARRLCALPPPPIPRETSDATDRDAFAAS